MNVDDVIKRLIKNLRIEYKQASIEMKRKFTEEMKAFKSMDDYWREMVEQGQRSQQEYVLWRQRQVLRHKRIKAMIDELAVDMSNVNRKASSIINKQSANVFSELCNHQMFEIEKDLKVLTAFNLYDKNVVMELGVVPLARNKVAKDIMWNKRKIRSAITQGILQGEDIPKIANRLQSVARMNNRIATRNARTFITAAENGGRQYGMEYAESIGVKLQKRWLATLDSRTRHSHAILDGETIPLDGKFSNGLRFPADVDAGNPDEIFNCRCSLISVVDGINMEVDPAKVRRANKLGGMSYDDWKAEHRKKWEKQKKVK